MGIGTGSDDVPAVGGVCQACLRSHRTLGALAGAQQLARLDEERTRKNKTKPIQRWPAISREAQRLPAVALRQCGSGQRPVCPLILRPSESIFLNLSRTHPDDACPPSPGCRRG